MIHARKLLKYSFNFLLNNPLLLFYGFIYFLPVIIAIVGVILLTISIGTLSLITFSFPTIINTVFGVLFGSFLALFVMIIFFFAVVVLSLGFTIYIQEHLKKSSATVGDSIKRSLRICRKNLWVVPVYMLYFFCEQHAIVDFRFYSFLLCPATFGRWTYVFV